MGSSFPQVETAKAIANGLEIAYDTFGEADAPPMLLIAGLGMPMIGWDEEFCTALAARGYQVIRFDNRDVGHSTHFDAAGVPDFANLLQTWTPTSTMQAFYTLRDMADDTAGLLDALGIPSAHVVGVSMGGMIAQELAIHHPDRVRTLTSIMSSTGNPKLPLPKAEAISILITPPPRDREAYIASFIQSVRVLSGPGFPPDESHLRERAARIWAWGLDPAGTARQLAAVLASGSRKEALKSVKIPTLVIHGDADPLVPVEGGLDTAEAIPGAKLMIIAGMGHDLPPALAPQIIEAIARHAK